MEQHAVPQDITGFKFKLVGDMTLKQFGELAFGAVIAYLFFASNWHPFLKWPLVIFFITLGVGLAFVPIQERPLDSWIINFFKAIYKPTYYVWKKNNEVSILPPLVVRDRSQIYSNVTSTPPIVNASPSEAVITQLAAQQVTTPIPQNENGQKDQKDSIPAPTASEPTKTTNEPASAVPQERIPLSVEQLLSMRTKQEEVPQVSEGGTGFDKNPRSASIMTIEELLKKRVQGGVAKDEKETHELQKSELKINELIEKNKNLLMQIDEIKNKMFTMAGQDTSVLQKQLDEIMVVKNALGVEIAKAREELTAARVAPVSNPSYQEPVYPQAYAKALEKPNPRPPVIALTELPNVINGIVASSNGIPLEGVILIIRDSTGNSIRALRTSKVGQFIASTPLANGKYYLELEKAGYSFDNWEVELLGKVLEPLEVRAKPNEQLAVNPSASLG